METQTLDIPVLWPNYFEDCEQCVERLRESIAGMDGMRSVVVAADNRSLEVSYDKTLLTFEEIREYARSLGVIVAERYAHEIVSITGLDCPDCAMKLENAVRKMHGVVWASLSFATATLVVEYEPQIIDLDAIRRRIKEFGYGIEEEEAKETRAARPRLIRSTRMGLTILSGVLFAAAAITAAARGLPSVVAILYIASAITGGLLVARSGLLSLKGLSLDTNFLMTAAAVGAVALGEYSEAAAVMFLYSLGSTLEAYTVDRTRRSIRSLIEAFPSSVTVKRNGHLTDVLIADVEIGETVIVRPGDKIPVDGTVIEGDSAVNEAPVTGESVPRDKHKGDLVYAGSINGRGSLELRVSSTAEDNTLARIVHMVEEAQAQKAPSQRFSETFGRYYTPVVLSLAVLVAFLGPLAIGSWSYRDAVLRALTLLVVACPCALVISTPVAIVAAIGSAARNGVLIKGGAHLETLGEVSVMAFDKTGTLTKGELEVVDIIPFNSHTAHEVLGIAASVERRSEHPLADAIVNKAQEIGLPDGHVSFFEAYPGKGAIAVANGNAYYVGSKRFIMEQGISVPESGEIDSLLQRGITVIYLADESSILGAIGTSDTIKPSSYEALHGLKSAGIVKTILLTGDTAQTGSLVAQNLGIDEYSAELLPEDKLRCVHDLSSQNIKVAMVGDGINDAPALAAANVGIAMGGAGSHIAVEAADVALMADDIVMLPYAVRLSRKARRVIHQNLIFAVLAVVLLIVGALLNRVTLSTGVLGHEGSALLVIANSMRLLRK